jgi:hypothetical protein
MKQTIFSICLLLFGGLSTTLAQYSDTLTFSFIKSDEQEIRFTNPADPLAVITWYNNKAVNPQRVNWGNQTVFIRKEANRFLFIDDATLDTLAILSQEKKTFNQLTLHNGQVYQWEKVPGQVNNQWQYITEGHPVAGVSYVKSGKAYRVSLSAPANSPEKLALGLASMQGVVAQVERGKPAPFWVWMIVGTVLAAIRVATA